MKILLNPDKFLPDDCPIVILSISILNLFDTAFSEIVVPIGKILFIF